MPGVVESPTSHEPYQTWGRDRTNPVNQRLQGLAGQYQGQYGTALGQQQASYDAFGQMAAGEGPSLAQSQLQQGMNQAQQAAVQSALNVRGGNAAGGQAAALQAATSFGGQAAVGAAQLAQAEQIAAMQAQAAQANAMAQQGLQGQMGMEGLYQQGLATQYQGDIDYRLGARGLREQERAGRNARIKGAIPFYDVLSSDERNKTDIQPTNADRIMQSNPYYGQQQEKGNGLGKILGLVSLLSDERTKRNLAPGNLAASQAVGELDPYTFEYEAGLGQPAGQHVGIMAQDLEKVAPQAVIDTPQGKMVNTAQGTGLALAATADHEQRMRDMESALGMATNQGPSTGRPEDARFEGRQQSAPSQPQRQFATMGNLGPVPADTDRQEGRAATMQAFDTQRGLARQADADAAALKAREGRVVSDESRRVAMQVGAAPQQRELGPNSLQQIDPNYGYREQSWSDTYEASPASAASSAMQRIYTMENPGPAIQPQGPMPSARPQNFRFVQPAQGGLAGMAQPQPQPVAQYDPRFDTYQGYGGQLAVNTQDTFPLGGIAGAYG